MGTTLDAVAPIQGVQIEPLQIIPDQRGAVLHMLRADTPNFGGFGEIYFSIIKHGVVKAWRLHRRMVCNLAVPVGAVRIAVFDSRSSSPTFGAVQSFDIGQAHYVLARIPCGVWYGFKGLGDGDSLIANCATIPHDPEEIERLPPDSATVPYRW